MSEFEKVPIPCGGRLGKWKAIAIECRDSKMAIKYPINGFNLNGIRASFYNACRELGLQAKSSAKRGDTNILLWVVEKEQS